MGYCTRIQRDSEKRKRAVAGATGFPETLDRLRQEARHDRDHAHQLQPQLQTLQSQRDGLQQTIDRMQIQKPLEEQLDVLESRESAEEPIEDLQLQLEGLLERRLAEEEKLSAARDALEEIDRQVRDREQGRSRTEHQVQEIRAQLEKLKMESRRWRLRWKLY